MNEEQAFAAVMQTINSHRPDPVVFDASFKDKLQKLLADLMQIHDKPITPDTPESIVQAICTQLDELLTSSKAEGPVKQHHIPRFCLFAAQIAAMRGIIKYQAVFGSHRYYNIYATHYDAVRDFRISRDQMGGVTLNFIKLLENPLLALHTMIAAGFHPGERDMNGVNNKKFEALSKVKNAYGEDAFELASRLPNTEPYTALLRATQPDLPSRIATKMLSMMEASGLTTNGFLRHLNDADNKKTFQSKLSLLIHHFFTHDILTLASTNCNELLQKDIPHRATAEGLCLLDQDAEGGSELEDVLEIFATMLCKLTDKRARQDFLVCEASINPAILCALAFSSAAKFGRFGRDTPYHVFAYEELLTKAFLPEELSWMSFGRWEIRVLTLLNLLRPLQSNEHNLEGEVFESPSTILECVISDNIDQIKYLLTRGKSLSTLQEATLKTALHLAVEYWNPGIAKFILDEHSTTFNALKDMRDSQGKTAYEYAVLSKSITWKHQEALLNEMKPTFMPDSPLISAESILSVNIPSHVIATELQTTATAEPVTLSRGSRHTNANVRSQQCVMS